MCRPDQLRKLKGIGPVTIKLLEKKSREEGEPSVNAAAAGVFVQALLLSFGRERVWC